MVTLLWNGCVVVLKLFFLQKLFHANTKKVSKILKKHSNNSSTMLCSTSKYLYLGHPTSKHKCMLLTIEITETHTPQIKHKITRTDTADADPLRIFPIFYLVFYKVKKKLQNIY